MISLAVAIEDKALWTEVHTCLETAAVRIDSEQEHVDNLAPFRCTLERTAPGAIIVTLNTAGQTGPVLECFRAGADDFLYPPLAEGLKQTLDRRRTEHRKIERDKPAGTTITFLLAKGGCGNTTLACHVAAELGLLKPKVQLADIDLNAGMVGFS